MDFGNIITKDEYNEVHWWYYKKIHKNISHNHRYNKKYLILTPVKPDNFNKKIEELKK